MISYTAYNLLKILERLSTVTVVTLLQGWSIFIIQYNPLRWTILNIIMFLNRYEINRYIDCKIEEENINS